MTTPETEQNQQTQKKPTFASLQSQRHFDIPDLAQLARVPEDTIWRMLNMRPVPRHEAVSVLDALTVTRLTEDQRARYNYSLDTVEVAIDGE